ncbi:MAG TPA: hypothetical protein VD757_02715, partial [Candidatus Nitrosocosmicus sp.]|nr:hypothetical protein [Candidatus Nitrosocosmicus sp.]
GFMKRIDDKITGFTVVVTDDKVKIEMPIRNLVNGFELSPNNYDQSKIKRGMRKQFAEWIADNLLDDEDSETGDNFIASMLDRLFERLFEGDEDFVKSGSEDDEE